MDYLEVQLTLEQYGFEYEQYGFYGPTSMWIFFNSKYYNTT